MAGGGAGG
ncbi:hypothetical protein YPPY36_4025, partial [Yersinia pestis PY-36]